MTKLSVNVNKIATLRNARGGDNPDVVRTALDCITFGAQGITVHPRPDERHIRRSDVRELAAAISVELNIEGYPSEDFLSLVEEVRPAQVTLVPDAPGQLTSDHGWDIPAHRDFLTDVVARIKACGARASIFVAAQPDMAHAAARLGADRIEMYTAPYADGYASERERVVEPFVQTAIAAREAGLGLNAGHDLSLDNLAYLHRRIPWMDEVSIGHALVCDALRLGLRCTIRHYLTCLGQ